MRFILLAVAIALFIAACMVEVANAHGKHNSPITPAYDCYYNPGGADTWGDVVIVHDSDIGVYVVWKCVCIYGSIGHRICYWKNMGQYTWKKNAVRRMRELTKNPKYNNAYVTQIRVQWSAFHRGIGCNLHQDRRYVIRVKRAG